MRLILIISLTSTICSCGFQGPSISFRPFDTASEGDLKNTEEAVSRAFQVVDARLKALEGEKNEASK